MKNEEMNVGEEKSGFFKKYFACLKLDTKSIARNAIVAALYAVLTYAFFFISYGNLQVRISEFMVLLCFFNPNYIYGLTLGCIVANIYSPAMSAFCSPLDIVIGTLATFLSCVCISLSRRMLVASFFPAIFNGLLLAWEFSFVAGDYSLVFFWTNAGFVAAGEVIAISILGYAIFMIMARKLKNFQTLVDAKFNLPLKW